MATLLKGKDAQRNPKTGLELGICAATIPNLNPGFTLAHNIIPPGYRSSTHSHTKVCRGTYVAKGRIRFFFGPKGEQVIVIEVKQTEGGGMAARGKALIAALQIEQSILLLRGHRVLLDSTLASLYGVQTKVLVQAVKRNRERFPSDFLLELNKQEVADLRSQIVTSSWGGRRYAPFAFTEQGVASFVIDQ